MRWIQSPISKLNHIYQVLKVDLAAEIDSFYNEIGGKVVERIKKSLLKDKQLQPKIKTIRFEDFLNQDN